MTLNTPKARFDLMRGVARAIVIPVAALTVFGGFSAPSPVAACPRVVNGQIAGPGCIAINNAAISCGDGVSNAQVAVVVGTGNASNSVIISRAR